MYSPCKIYGLLSKFHFKSKLLFSISTKDNVQGSEKQKEESDHGASWYHQEVFCCVPMMTLKFPGVKVASKLVRINI